MLDVNRFALAHRLLPVANESSQVAYRIYTGSGPDPVAVLAGNKEEKVRKQNCGQSGNEWINRGQKKSDASLLAAFIPLPLSDDFQRS